MFFTLFVREVPGRVLALGALMLVLLAGLCLAQGHDLVRDPCATLFGATAVVMLVVMLTAGDRFVPLLAEAYRFVPADSPAPPPRR